MLEAVADKEGVLLSSRQTDRQVEAQLKTLVPRHVRNMNYTDVACHAVLKLGSCKLDFYEMIIKE